LFVYSIYREFTKTKLLSYCGLNTIEHEEILDDMVSKGILVKSEEPVGTKQ
jgi:predicted transcriptional regulator